MNRAYLGLFIVILRPNDNRNIITALNLFKTTKKVLIIIWTNMGGFYPFWTLIWPLMGGMVRERFINKSYHQMTTKTIAPVFNRFNKPKKVKKEVLLAECGNTDTAVTIKNESQNKSSESQIMVFS